MNINKTHPLADRFLINEIDYAGEDMYVVYGFAEINGCCLERATVTNKDGFVRLMARNIKVGEQVINQLAKIKAYPHAVPVSVDLVALFGMTQEFIKQV